MPPVRRLQRRPNQKGVKRTKPPAKRVRKAPASRGMSRDESAEEDGEESEEDGAEESDEESEEESKEEEEEDHEEDKEEEDHEEEKDEEEEDEEDVEESDDETQRYFVRVNAAFQTAFVQKTIAGGRKGSAFGGEMDADRFLHEFVRLITKGVKEVRWARNSPCFAASEGALGAVAAHATALAADPAFAGRGGLFELWLSTGTHVQLACRLFG